MSSQPRSNRASDASRRDAPNAAAARPAAASHRQRPWRSPILLITARRGRRRHGRGRGRSSCSRGGPTRADTTALTTPTSPTPVALADGRTLGKADAPVTLEVWTDFQCPICGEYARTVEPALVSRYVTPGTLRIVHHDAAFQGQKSSATYDESVEAAAGARCAADQGGYWPFQDWAFANQAGENQGAFAAPRLTAIARPPAWTSRPGRHASRPGSSRRRPARRPARRSRPA